MKTIIAISTLVLIGCTSCVKQYTCVCDDIYGGSIDSIINDSKKAATKKCNDLADLNVVYESCKLSE